MSNKTALQLFVTDLRRVLYLSQIYMYSLDWMKAGELCPSYLKNDIQNIQNSIKRMLNDMMCKSTPEMWERVSMELKKEELHDISLLIDSMYDVTNVGDIVKVIEESKMAAV